MKRNNLEKLLENIMNEEVSSDGEMEMVEQYADYLLTETVDKIFDVMMEKSDYFDSILNDKLGMNVRDPREMFFKLVIKRMQEELVKK